MPHFALHILLASRVLAFAEEDEPERHDPSCRNAFLHGAIGPDMGFFPGGVHLLSLAAHALRSGDLARTLHETSETPEQWAFARGWLTHMLGDVLIHPLINRAAAQFLEREGIAATAASRHAAHIRIELGLDALCAAQYHELRNTRLRPFFAARTAHWLNGAFRSVHGVELDVRAVIRSHYQVVRLQRPLLFLERLVAMGQDSERPFRGLVRGGFVAFEQLARSRLGADSPVSAFLGPIKPSESLVEAVAEVTRDFPTSFVAFSRLVLASHVNYSLDAGHREVPSRPTPEAINVAQRLAARRYAQDGGADAESYVA